MERKIRILIVEDESLIAENLRLTLEDLGYEVIGTCYSYAEALNAFETSNADLVMLDINLGGDRLEENGIALAERLVTDSRCLFIFLTAYSDMDTIRIATKLRPSGYLIKPVNAASLFAAIQTAFENTNRSDNPATQEANKPDYFFLKVGTKNVKVMWDDICIIEAGKNYVRLRSLSMKIDYPIRGTLTFVLDQLLPERLQPDFLRVSRSVSLNRRFITAFTNKWIYCAGERFENTRFSTRELADAIPGN